MVDVNALQRRFSYALMPVLWLAVHLAMHFGNTNYWLRVLSMPFDLVADDPVSFSEAMGEQTQRPSFFDDVSGSTEPQANPLFRSRVWLNQAAQSVPVMVSSRSQYWRSLFQHFLAYHQRRRRQEQQRQNSGSASGSAAGAASFVFPAAHALQQVARFVLPCFTSLFVHYNRACLLNTIASYAYTLGMCVSQRHFASARWEGLQDVIGALTAAVFTNLIFRCTIGSITPSGRRKEFVSALVQLSPVLSAIASTAAGITVALQSSLPFLANRHSEAEVHTRPPPTHPDNSDAISPSSTSRMPSLTPSTASSSANSASMATTVNSHNDVGRDGSAAATIDTFDTPHGYLGGGEGVAYGLAGFRLGRYHEVDQLRGAVWQFIAGFPVRISSSLSVHKSIIDLLRQRDTSANDANSSTNHNSVRQEGRLSRSAPHSDDAAFDVFYATASSSELYILINGGSFLSGIALGATVRAMPSLRLWARHHIVWVRVLEDYLWPPPPPALWLPRELDEAVPANLKYDKVELIRVEVGAEVFRQFPPSSLGEPLSELASLHSHAHLGNGDAHGCADADTDFATAETTEAFGDGSTTESTIITERGLCLTLLVPSRCICPITRSLMHDPVRTEDGFTYERDAISAWLDHHESSPMTNLPLTSRHLSPDKAIRQEVADAVQRFLERVGPDYTRAE